MLSCSLLTTLLVMILGRYYTRNTNMQSLSNLFVIMLGKDHTRNAYPQSLINFTRNNFGYVPYPQFLPTVTLQCYGYDLGVGTIPIMPTRSCLTTLPVMICGRYHTRNTYPRSTTLPINDLGYVLCPQCKPVVAEQLLPVMNSGRYNTHNAYPQSPWVTIMIWGRCWPVVAY